MDKNTTKKTETTRGIKHNTYNQELVIELAGKYEVSRNFIYLAIRGERTSKVAQAIKVEYNKVRNQMLNVVRSTPPIKK